MIDSRVVSITRTILRIVESLALCRKALKIGKKKGLQRRPAETPSNEVEILPAEKFDDIGHTVTFGRKS